MSFHVAVFGSSEPRETDEAYAARIETLIRNTTDSLARDTLINEARLHYQIHRWLADPQTDRSFDALNARVSEGGEDGGHAPVGDLAVSADSDGKPRLACEAAGNDGRDALGIKLNAIDLDGVCVH